MNKCLKDKRGPLDFLSNNYKNVYKKIPSDIKVEITDCFCFSFDKRVSIEKLEKGL